MSCYNNYTFFSFLRYLESLIVGKRMKRRGTNLFRNSKRLVLNPREQWTHHEEIDRWSDTSNAQLIREEIDLIADKLKTIIFLFLRKTYKFLFLKNPSERQFYLKPKHHIELLALEPGNSIRILRHGQWLSADSKDKPADLHDPETIEETTEREDKLSQYDDKCKQHCSKTNAKNPINETNVMYCVTPKCLL